MAKPRRPAGAGEVAFYEQAHRPSLTRHPKLSDVYTQLERRTLVQRCTSVYRTATWTHAYMDRVSRPVRVRRSSLVLAV